MAKLDKPDKSLLVIAGANSLLGKSLINDAASRGHATLGIARSGSSQADYSITADLAIADCNEAIQEIAGRFAAVHAINCAGYFPGFLRIHAADTDIFLKCIHDNFMTTVALARAVLPRMRTLKSGHFLALSSHMIDEACPYMGPWNCAKAAVEALIKTISNEYLGDGVVANVVRLPTLDTPSERSLKPGGDFDRWLRPSEVAEFCLNLIELGNMCPRSSALHFFKPSLSFYGQSFLGRNGLASLERPDL